MTTPSAGCSAAPGRPSAEQTRQHRTRLRPITIPSGTATRQTSNPAAATRKRRQPAAPGSDGPADRAGRAQGALASDSELLLNRDIAECGADELAEIARLVDRMRLVAPVRPSGWRPSSRAGRAVDLRRTLRAACRTGGDPVHWRHRRRGTVDRKLVLLADVSGSMQAYSRMYLRLLQGAVVGARAHA